MNQNPDALLASGAAAGVAAGAGTQPAARSNTSFIVWRMPQPLRGFNAPIAGIFFASEAVLRQSVVLVDGAAPHSKVVRPADDNQLDLTTRPDCKLVLLVAQDLPQLSRLLAAAVSAAVVQSFLPATSSEP